jgi:small-conductance mechanosensitive channel
VDIPCGIAYGESVDRARAILLGIAATHPEILKEPDVPTVLVMALSDSSVNLQLRVWVKTDDYWKVYFALNQAIYDKFNEVGIEIPFNQLQVHLTQK